MFVWDVRCVCAWVRACGASVGRVTRVCRSAPDCRCLAVRSRPLAVRSRRARCALPARALFQKCYGFVHFFKSAMVLCTFSKVQRCPLRISVRSRRAVGGLSTRLGLFLRPLPSHPLASHPVRSYPLVHTHSFTPHSDAPRGSRCVAVRSWRAVRSRRAVHISARARVAGTRLL